MLRHRHTTIMATEAPEVVPAPPGVRPLVSKNVGEPSDLPALKEVGLRVLTTLVKHVRPTLRPVQRVAQLVENISGSLFQDWSPAVLPPQVPVVLAVDKCTASCFSSSSYNSDKALQNSGHWQSTARKEEAWWQVLTLSDAVPLQSITLACNANYLSQTVEIRVSPLAESPPRPKDLAPGSPDPGWVSLGYLPGAKLASKTTIHLDNVYTRRIRVVFRGFPKKNSSKAHSLQTFSCTRAKAKVLHTKSSEMLAGVESWLLRAASDSTNAACQEAALGALMKLALKTGAVTAVAHAVQVALAAKDKALTPAFADAGFAFLKSLRDQYFEVCQGSTTSTGSVVKDGAWRRVARVSSGCVVRWVLGLTLRPSSVCVT